LDADISGLHLLVVDDHHLNRLNDEVSRLHVLIRNLNRLRTTRIGAGYCRRIGCDEQEHEPHEHRKQLTPVGLPRHCLYLVHEI
jgi:hypothetical protein